MQHGFVPSAANARGYAHWLRCAGEWLERGRAFVLVTILATQGSAPQKAAAKMLVAADETLGTVGGGNLEQKAIASARQLLQDKNATQRVCVWPLAAAAGQCCGGRVAALFERCALAVPAVAVFGMGHVGREAVAILRRLPYALTLVDMYEDEGAMAALGVLPADFPAVTRGGAEQIARLPDGAAALIMTHSHDLDFQLCCAALARDFAYVGVIGSAAKAASFRRRLRARGLPAQRLVCPMGEGGAYPAEIAVSICADVVRCLSPKSARPSAASKRESAALMRALGESLSGEAPPPLPVAADAEMLAESVAEARHV